MLDNLKCRFSGLFACCLLTVALGAAFHARPAAARPDDYGDATVRPQIVVTGTRLSLPELREAEPRITLDDTYVAERNHAHFANALNEIPGFRGSLTPDGAQSSFGQGVNFINAFGLGSHRTLTLLDGKRVVTSNSPTNFSAASPGTQVDLNAIPSILIDRVDRLAIGGAPVYGSDAIAGTVNVILKRRMQGFTARALSGVTGEGDNFRWKLATAGGFDFAGGRANLTVAASYDRADGVRSTGRSFYRDNLAPAPNPCTAFQPGLCSPLGTLAMLGPPGRDPATDGRVNPNIGFNDGLSDGNPASVLVRDFGLAAVAPGGALSSGPGAYSLRFAPDGSLVPYARGTLFGAPLSGPFAPVSLSSGGDGLKLFDYVAITSRIRRFNAAAFATYNLDDRLTLFADALYYEGKASEPVDLPGFNAVQFGGASGALTLRTDNPFLTAQARQQLAAMGYGETFQISRANTDLADRSGASRNRLYRIVAGMKGSLAMGGRDYDFELSANYGRSDFADYGQAIDQQRFINAVNVTAGANGIVCSSTPTVSGLGAGAVPIADPGCVPLNLFGEGAPSPEALDYILRNTAAKSRLEQIVFNANIGGSPFALFGNPVSFNAGFEHREEKARFSPDAFMQAGLGRSVPIAPVSGSYNLDEVFGEAVFPLITPDSGAPVSSLIAFARARHVRSNTNGGFTAWSAGGSFAPVRDIELRGNFTRSFRSPAIFELFSPRASIATPVEDLCSASQINAGPAPDIRSANCTAFLARYPNATPLIAATASAPGLAGGNPDLRNEQADSYTLGVLVRPRFAPGLSLSADYLDITITDPIANLTVAEIAQGCFDNPQFNASDPANGNPFCALIRRDASGQVISDPQNPAVITGFVNGKRIAFSGVQAALNYHTDLAALGIGGSLQIGADVFHLRRRVIDITGVAPDRTDGIVGDPRWQGQLRLRYASKSWNLRTHINYTGKQLFARDNRAPAPNDTREFNVFDAFVTVDTSLTINAQEGMNFTFSITNLFNRVGEKYYGFRQPLTINDALGRRFAVSISKDF